MSCRLCVTAAFAMFVSAVGAPEAAPTKVKVVNGRGTPALVMDQTVLQPVHGNASVRVEAGSQYADLELMTPPAGKMVVIQYVTIRLFAEDEKANAFMQLEGDLGEGGLIEHGFEALPPPLGLGVLTLFQQTLTQQLLFYSTGPVVLTIDRGQMRTKLGIFDVSFSGYLVKAPN